MKKHNLISKNNNMTVLVTGGAGFIGSSLIKQLKKERPKIKITSLDNYFTGHTNNHISEVEYIKGDCSEIMELFYDRTFDLIFHFGEYSRIETSFQDIKLATRYILNGTPTVLEFASSKNARLIYSASSSKFGGDNENLSPYAWMKGKMVELVKNYNYWFNLQYDIVYFYNVYGDGQIEEGKYATVVGLFAQQFLKNEKITVVKPGSQKRDFTHIDDITSGLIKIMDFPERNSEWHLRRGKPISILSLAKLFGNEIEFLEERPGNRIEAIPSEDTTYSRLDWKPSNNIEDWIEGFKKKFK